MSFYLMHRGWMDNEALRGEPYDPRSAWVWLVEHAQWEATIISIDRKPVQLARGEMSFSERFLAGKWQWSRSKVHRFLADLTTFGMIHLRNSPVQKSDHQRDHPQNILTICNYNKYQDIGTISRTLNGTIYEPSMNHLPDQRRKKEIQEEDSEAIASAASPRDLVKEMWQRGKAVLGPSGASLIGKAIKGGNTLVVMEAIIACENEAPADPIAFFLGCLRSKTNGRDKRSPVEKLHAGAMAAADEITRRQMAEREEPPDGGLDKPPSFTLLDGGRSRGEPTIADRGLVDGFGKIRS